ncbi:hypothetical protein DAEQUDRAFT_730059 [Daedalea quercina L-15889]|uniref:Uncharacterized protein n=1 Tax=Daedalea quercina L-15889 TaxID=1314783 RepID=A0A165N8B2_9APHY|nr:hypothetical protein DAEQUDRAFT_730059 [Daedalea quercina L-15889]
MIVLSEDSMAAKTAGPLRDPELLVSPPPYQEVDVRRGGPSTRPREPSFSAANGESSVQPIQSLSPSPLTSSPYLSVPGHRRDFSTASTRSLSPYAPSHDDALARFASTPALAPRSLPASPLTDTEFYQGEFHGRRARRLDRSSRGFKLSTNSDGLAAILSSSSPSFQRSRAADVPYSPFKPISLLGISTDLTRSFPRMAPPHAYGDEHPFATHDVTEQDWSLFLRNVEEASRLSTWDHIMATVKLPHVLGLSIGLVVKGIDIYMQSRRRGPVGELIGYWNHNFFHSRHIHVVLARGAKTYSGSDLHPPDMPTISENESECERSKKLKESEVEYPKCWRLVVTYIAKSADCPSRIVQCSLLNLRNL